MANSTQGRLNHLIYGASAFNLQLPTPNNSSNHATSTLPPGGRLDHNHTRESTAVRVLPKSSSSSSHKEDPFDMYFNYPLYEGRHQYEGETDATTQSDVFSEGSPETTPSAVTTDSSVGTGPDFDEDIEMPDAAPVSPAPHNNKENLWPKVSNTDLPRYPIIHDQDDLTPHAEATLTPVALPLRHARRPSRSSASPIADPRKKTRRVPEPQKTSKVRENGACTLCKGSRISCSVDGVCDGCKRLCAGCHGVVAEKVCIRRALQDSVVSMMNRWCQDSMILLPSSGFQPSSGSMAVFIYFSEDPQSPRLQMQAVKCPKGLVIISDNGPSHHEAISRWTREHLGASANRSFDSLLQQLLAVFVEGGALDLEPSSSSVFVGFQREWMKKLLRMRCMWNAWSCRKFYVRDINGQLVQDSTQPIHEYLHRYAGQKISELEKDILKEIDKLQNGIKVGDSAPLLSAYHVGVWISLWQLALMYRHSSGASLGFRTEQFRETTEDLYNKVVVLFSVIFRTTKALNYLMDARSKAFSGKPVVGKAFENAWRARNDFYNSFRKQYPGDEFVSELVIGKEAKVLSRKRAGRK
ncbi:hypothetical protein B0T16DRAFT_453058 [Cercophora newfieldiana]|uniref:Uncharacterized protein n=1 Tax=Cercophora newfieldiana TaxID=92897 RepID=A0AA40D2A3_9PEZI|nr:hypothetical protein B0T16DRAFT_453058 [Cercophora newfieldiana]